jgi:hypothetical protein
MKLRLAADRLHDSTVETRRAETLRFIPPTAEEMLFVEPIMMLYGMALECLLKSLAAKNGFVFVDESGPEPEFKAPNKNHNLVTLAKSEWVRLDPLTDQEEDLLERLTAFIRFAGRYPVGISWNSGSTEAEDGGYDPGPIWMPTDKALIDRLIGRMLMELAVPLDADGLPILPDSL